MGTRPRCADAFRLQLDAWPAKKKGQVLLAPYREVPGKVPEAERGEVEGRGAKRQGRGRGSEREGHKARKSLDMFYLCVCLCCEGATSSTHSCAQRAPEACSCSFEVRVCV